MRYLLMIFSREADAATDQTPEVMSKYFAFTEQLKQSGISKEGEGLHDSTKATSVRTHNGKFVITDGPFAETKEQMSGYYLLNVKDLDEAIEIAKQCPGSSYGTVELRPVMEFGN